MKTQLIQPERDFSTHSTNKNGGYFLCIKTHFFIEVSLKKNARNTARHPLSVLLNESNFK